MMTVGSWWKTLQKIIHTNVMLALSADFDRHLTSLALKAPNSRNPITTIDNLVR